MRYLLVFSLMLAAMLTLTQTMALQSAAVSSRQTIPVTTTSAALLALAPGLGPGNSGGSAFLVGDTLLLDLRKGNGATNWGFLQNTLPYTDQYRFKNLFTVTNQSGSSQCVTVWVSGIAPDIAGVYLRPSGTPVSDAGTQVAGAGGSYLGCLLVGVGAAVEVDFWFAIGPTAAAYSFDVRVEATRP